MLVPMRKVPHVNESRAERIEEDDLFVPADQQLEREILGVDDVDPLQGKARSRRHSPGSTDGAACVKCFEPLRGPVRVLIVGGVTPAFAHEDCDDPDGDDAPFDCRRRLF